MSKQNDQIHEGIVFEEEVINILAHDLEKLQEYLDLSEEKRNSIKHRLQIMQEDSMRHRTLLLGIAKKY
jgi:hypothetical protein